MRIKYSYMRIKYSLDFLFVLLKLFKKNRVYMILWIDICSYHNTYKEGNFCITIKRKEFSLQNVHK